MTKLNIEHILLFMIVAFLFYHLIGNCNCRMNGFSVGGDASGINFNRKASCTGCSYNNCKLCTTTGYCGQSVENCETSCSGKWCGQPPLPPPPPPPVCTEPCKVKYTPCIKPAIDQSIINNIKDKDTFIKVVYISAWMIQGTKEEWLNHFTKLVAAGYNVIIISFIPQQNLNLNIPNWDILTCDEKTDLKKYLISHKAVLLLSIGGGAAPKPTPITGTSSNCIFNWIDLLDGTDNYVAKYAYNQMFDGIDFDLEWFSPGNTIKGCSDKLAQQADIIKKYYKSKGKLSIITSAPQTPYFTKNSWAIDYVQLEKDHPTSFDFYNIQFYNNNNGNTKESTIGSKDKPNTALYMIDRGIPNTKLVLGKCGKGGNCCIPSFYVGGSKLIQWASENHLKGIMYWSYLGGCIPEATDWLNSK